MSACWISLFRSGVGCCCVNGLEGAFFLEIVLDFAGAGVVLGGAFAVWGVAGIATPQTRSNAVKITLPGNGNSYFRGRVPAGKMGCQVSVRLLPLRLPAGRSARNATLSPGFKVA